MIIKANKNFSGILDLSSLERLQEDNPLERLPFHLTIKPGQLIEVDDKWYNLKNIQSSLKIGYIKIIGYNEQMTFPQEITTIESYTNTLSLTKVEIWNRSNYPQDAFAKYNENFDQLDTVINSVSQSNSAAWGAIYGDINDQSDLQIELNEKANVSGQVFSGNVSAQNITIENSLTFNNMSTGDSNVTILTGTNTFAKVTINGETYAMLLYKIQPI